MVGTGKSVTRCPLSSGLSCCAPPFMTKAFIVAAGRDVSLLLIVVSICASARAEQIKSRNEVMNLDQEILGHKYHSRMSDGLRKPRCVGRKTLDTFGKSAFVPTNSGQCMKVVQQIAGRERYQSARAWLCNGTGEV